MGTEAEKMSKNVFCPVRHSWSRIRERETQYNWKDVIMELYRLLQKHSPVFGICTEECIF